MEGRPACRIGAGTPVSNLFVRLMSSVGLEAEKFADSTGRLTADDRSKAALARFREIVLRRCFARKSLACQRLTIPHAKRDDCVHGRKWSKHKAMQMETLPAAWKYAQRFQPLQINQHLLEVSDGSTTGNPVLLTRLDVAPEQHVIGDRQRERGAF